MSWSFLIGRVLGIEVRVHVTFLLLLAFFGFLYYNQGGADAAIHGVIFILLLFACVLLHEFGHAFAARAYGIHTPDITLLPIGGVARLERMPDKPYEELVVALAGPAVNVAIAAALFVVLGGRIDPAHMGALSSPGGGLLVKLLYVNLLLVFFNLLPAFPMDGGRVLRALLATRLTHARATQIAATIGQGMAFVFGFAGLLWNPMLVLIAVFIYFGASQEAALAQMKDAATGLPVRSAMVTNFSTLNENADIDEAVELLLATSQQEFPVVDQARQVLGILTRDDMIRALRRTGGHTAVVEVMRRDIPAVHAGTNFEEAFRTMQRCACPALPVLNSQGQLVGLFTPENVGEFMMIHSALGRRDQLAWRSRISS